MITSKSIWKKNFEFMAMKREFSQSYCRELKVNMLVVIGFLKIATFFSFHDKKVD